MTAVIAEQAARPLIKEAVKYIVKEFILKKLTKEFIKKQIKFAIAKAVAKFLTKQGVKIGNREIGHQGRIDEATKKKLEELAEHHLTLTKADEKRIQAAGELAASEFVDEHLKFHWDDLIPLWGDGKFVVKLVQLLATNRMKNAITKGVEKEMDKIMAEKLESFQRLPAVREHLTGDSSARFGMPTLDKSTFTAVLENARALHRGLDVATSTAIKALARAPLASHVVDMFMLKEIVEGLLYQGAFDDDNPAGSIGPKDIPNDDMRELMKAAGIDGDEKETSGVFGSWSTCDVDFGDRSVIMADERMRAGSKIIVQGLTKPAYTHLNGLDGVILDESPTMYRVRLNNPTEVSIRKKYIMHCGNFGRRS